VSLNFIPRGELRSNGTYAVILIAARCHVERSETSH
jgi:hypothetical protein